jgi:hypothetical protein
MNNQILRVMVVPAFWLMTSTLLTADGGMPPPSVPDGGSTAAILMLGLGGLGIVRMFLGRNREKP